MIENRSLDHIVWCSILVFCRVNKLNFNFKELLAFNLNEAPRNFERGCSKPELNEEELSIFYNTVFVDRVQELALEIEKFFKKHEPKILTLTPIRRQEASNRYFNLNYPNKSIFKELPISKVFKYK